jgi:hypothetical protein
LRQSSGYRQCLAWHISLQDVEFFHAFLPAHQRAQPDTQWVEGAAMA